MIITIKTLTFEIQAAAPVPQPPNSLPKRDLTYKQLNSTNPNGIQQHSKKKRKKKIASSSLETVLFVNSTSRDHF